MPVTEMSFPTITICKQGLDMAAVQRALELDYEAWVEQQSSSGKRKRATVDIDTFLKEKLFIWNFILCITDNCFWRFSFDSSVGYTMTDIIEAMASPNVDATAGTNAVVENAIACYSSGNIGSNYFQMRIFILKQSIFWGRRRQATECRNNEIAITQKEKCVKIGPRVDIRVCPDDASEYCEPGYVFYDNKNNGWFRTLYNIVYISNLFIFFIRLVA